MVNQDLYRQTLEEMVDPRHPLVVLARRIPWDQLEARIEPLMVRNLRSARSVPQDDLFGPSLQIAGVRGGGRPRLPTRLMLSLLYLKHAFNESDESLVCALDGFCFLAILQRPDLLRTANALRSDAYRPFPQDDRRRRR